MVKGFKKLKTIFARKHFPKISGKYIYIKYNVCLWLLQKILPESESILVIKSIFRNTHQNAIG